MILLLNIYDLRARNIIFVRKNKNDVPISYALGFESVTFFPKVETANAD